MSNRKQSTLLKFGFSKKIEHRGELHEVSSKEFCSEEPGLIKCDNCNNSFKTRQGLAMHRFWAHSKESKSSSSDSLKFTAAPTQSGSVENDVKEVLKQLISDADKVCEDKEKDANKAANQLSKAGRRGSKKRKQYDFIFKAKILDQIDQGINQRDVALQNGIDESLVSKWKGQRKEIIDGAASKHRKLFAKNRKSGKHNQVFVRLHAKMVESRRKGMKVSFSWLYTHANKIKMAMDNDGSRIPKAAIVKFIRQYKIKLRRVQRKKRTEKVSFIPKLMNWHCTLREGLIKTGSQKPNYDSKWGRFPPEKRFNVDQVPLPFAIDRKTTYEVEIPKEEKRYHKVWVSNPGSGLEKRQCTLQIAFSPVKDSLRIAVIFRGTGKRITADEIKAYDSDVDVYWQENAWADTKMSVEWVNRTLAPAVAHLDEFILFCDNLEAQVSLPFQEAVRRINGIIWYGVANATDLWQPIDAGAGYLLKKMVDIEQQKWLEDEENIEKWLGNSEEKLSAKERRILLTHWIGQAYRQFRSEKYDKSRYNCFQKTGCLITADGSEDRMIKPEGLEGYSVPPPLPTIASSDAFLSEAPEPSAPPLDDIPSADDFADISNEIDNEEDRTETHHLVGKKFEILYDFGWCTGIAVWFNIKMGKLRLTFDDDSDDYIDPREIDGVEIICL